jgi:hypothetical protein
MIMQIYEQRYVNLSGNVINKHQRLFGSSFVPLSVSFFLLLRQVSQATKTKIQIL